MNRETVIHDIISEDGFTLRAKFDYPDEKYVDKIVLFCHGSGPNTFDNHRMVNGIEFDYFELFAAQLCKRRIGFCRWNTRGCSPSGEEPCYAAVDKEEYQTYYPNNSIADILSVVKYVKRMERFCNASIILLGASEGAMLAPFVAVQCRDIAALMLMGLSYSNIKNTLEWQLSGSSSMVITCKCFDYDKKGYVTKADFEEDRYGVRSSVFPESEFEDLDKNGDGRLTEQDFAVGFKDYRVQVFQAIASNDDDWLEKNYSVYLTSKWFNEHFALPPVEQPLMKLQIPVHVFRGEDDANIPASDIEALMVAISKFGKTNIKIHVFPNHDHDLNYLAYPLYGQLSQGLQTVFETIETIVS